MVSRKPEAENELEIYGELKREWSNYGDYMREISKEATIVIRIKRYGEHTSSFVVCKFNNLFNNARRNS